MDWEGTRAGGWRRLVRSLREEYGVGNGDCVVTVCDNRPEVCPALMSWAAECVIADVHIDAGLPEDRCNLGSSGH